MIATQRHRAHGTDCDCQSCGGVKSREGPRLVELHNADRRWLVELQKADTLNSTRVERQLANAESKRKGEITSALEQGWNGQKRIITQEIIEQAVIVGSSTGALTDAFAEAQEAMAAGSGAAIQETLEKQAAT